LVKEPVAASVATGEPEIRADFRLVDQAGVTRTPEDFVGRWVLVLFGFTHCPDICPTGLATMAAVLESLGRDASAVQPVFITVDPERDTPAVLAEFVPAFHSWTGRS
jgi:protein SCO1/2